MSAGATSSPSVRAYASLALPAAVSVDARLTLHIIADLKTKWVQNVRPIYSEEVQAHDVPTWNTVSDLVRHYD